MNSKRPINLDLATFKFPTMAIVSILHRISGVVMMLLLPVILYFLSLSLSSNETFNELQLLLTQPFYKLLLWGFSVAMAYHIIAGLRHVYMDLGFGEGLQSSKRSANLVVLLSIITAVILGVWIC